MITINLGVIEEYDAQTNEFNKIEGGIVRFEYSLKVVYDWEGIWRKPFLNSKLTDEQYISLFKLMALDPLDERFINDELALTLVKYINDQSTATVFSNNDKTNNSSKFITAEELYVTMFQAGFPLELENINLNRLMVMLRILSNKSEKPKKMSRQDVLRQNAELNRQRREALKTKG